MASNSLPPSLRPETALRYRDSVQQALIFLEERLTEPISLEQLAEVSGFSPHYFHRIFTAVVGESVKAYIRRLRLERAVGRLKTSRDTVLEIALESGFNTHESFTRSFVNQYAMSPAEFRAWLRAFRHLSAESGRSFSLAGLSNTDPLTLSRSPEPQIPVAIEPFPQMNLAFVRYWGPYEGLASSSGSTIDLWGPLFEWAEGHQLDRDRLQLIGLCHDDPFVTPPERIRFDAGIVVPGRMPGGYPVGFKRLDPGICAVRRHSGDFSEMTRSFAYLGVEWQPPPEYRVRATGILGRYELSDANQIISAETYVPLKLISKEQKGARNGRI
ncbi:MAG: AraC family transcriptional regulator [Anaerolineales bacterium]|nr:AraC family transcriptional regulator [Anaerolineales bacterium]